VSSPRYWWWASVRAAIRQYPALQRRKDDLQAQQETKCVQSITGPDGKRSDYYAPPGGGGNGRTVERLALAELPPAEERILEAVRSAVEATELAKDGAEHMALLRDYFWRGQRLQDAADRHYVAYNTAKRWVGTFSRRVARGLGYLPERQKQPETRGGAAC